MGIPATRRFPLTLALMVGASMALASCSGMTGNARTDGAATAAASGDGVLRVGLILDNTGDGSYLNDSQQAAARLAVKEINAAGGLKARQVELLPAAAGQDTAAQAHRLVESEADVVIGPTDSSHAAEAIDVLSRARTPLISPANTAAGLTAIDSGGYYFRTAAADVAQGPLLAKLAGDGGATTVSVLYQDSAYGKDVATAAAEAARQAGLDVVANTAFKPGEARSAAAAAGAAAPGAVILIARDGAEGALQELAKAGVPGTRLILSDGAFARYGSALAPKALTGARALVPGKLPTPAFQARLLAVAPDLKDVSFAAETFDAVTLAVLAAAKAADDSGASIAANLIAVSGGTTEATATAPAVTPCLSYADCLPAAGSGPGINYDGESGPVAFDANGDITAATYSVFRYGDDNVPAASGTETAGRAGS